MNRIWILALALCATDAWAWPPTYGPEWNFHGDNIPTGMSHSDAHDKVMDDFAEAVRKKCRVLNCAVTKEIDPQYGFTHQYRVTFADGYHVEITTDFGVIEIKGKPETAARYSQPDLQREIQAVVFDTAKSLHLETNPESQHGQSAGHVNIGFESGFGGDVRLLDAFIADMMRRPELGNGFMGRTLSSGSGPHLARFGLAFLKEYEQLHRDTQTGSITLEAYAKRLNGIYEKTGPTWGESLLVYPDKAQAINIKTLALSGDPALKRVELRFVRMQDNSGEFAELGQVFDRWIESEKSKVGQVTFNAEETAWDYSLLMRRANGHRETNDLIRDIRIGTRVEELRKRVGMEKGRIANWVVPNTPVAETNLVTVDESLGNARIELESGELKRQGGIMRLLKLMVAAPERQADIMPLLRQTLAAPGEHNQIEIESQLTTGTVRDYLLALSPERRAMVIQTWSESPGFRAAVAKNSGNTHFHQDIENLLSRMIAEENPETARAVFALLEASPESTWMSAYLIEKVQRLKNPAIREDIYRRMAEGEFPRVREQLLKTGRLAIKEDFEKFMEERLVGCATE